MKKMKQGEKIHEGTKLNNKRSGLLLNSAKKI
jgi:hypothetical protein